MQLDLAALRSRSAEAPTGPFRLLVVCTGNICRSAFAAAYLDAVLTSRLGRGAVIVESAGTDVALDLEMPAPISAAIRGVGADPDLHVIEMLDPDAAASADLVVTMTKRQRAEVARRAPRAASKVVTMKQFARLCRAAPLPQTDPEDTVDRKASAGRVRAAVTTAVARRGLDPVVGDDDIADPWMKSDDVYARSIDEIRVAGGEILAYLLAAAGKERV